MPSPDEGVLNDTQKQSLEIVDFIFHIIQPNADGNQEVVFLDEVQLQSKQKTFFLDRLKDIAEGTQYVFKPDSVHLKEKCQQLLGQHQRFTEISRQLTSDFSDRHKGHMSAGVFVVTTVKYLAEPDRWEKLAFLVKMDKRPSFSYSYQEVDGKRFAVLEEIENSLNETKSAIQKCALIDVSDRFAWDVLAFDRSQRVGLTEYFRGFLGVTERQQDSVLTHLAHTTVRQWAKKLSEQSVPSGEDRNTYAGRSLNYLSDQDVFDTEAYLNAVVRDDDQARKTTYVDQLRLQLAEAGVAGQQFKPKPASLTPRLRRQTYQTAEGVVITYEGDNEAVGITIEDAPGGRKLIKILTNRLKTKD